MKQTHSEYDCLARTYDSLMERSPYYQNIRHVERCMLRRAIGRNEPETMLDLGCGTGFACGIAAGAGLSVVGIDPSAAMLHMAAGRLRGIAAPVNLVCARVEEMPRLSAPFDLIVGFGSVFNHVDDWDAFFRRVVTHSKPGSQLLLTIDNLLGIDSWTWAAYQLLDGNLSGLKDLRMRIIAAFKQRPHFNAWTLGTEDGTTLSHLRYERAGRIIELLKKHGFRFVRAEGANCLAALSRATTLASTGTSTKTRVTMTNRVLARIDQCIAMHSWRLASNYVVWAEYTPTS